MTTFAKILDSADGLTLDEQEQLAETMRRRVAAKRRAEIVGAVKESRAEYAAGRIKPATSGAIMKKILS
jgi:hypothetical protein